MNIRNIIEQIETITFETQFSVANSLNILLMALERDETIKNLADSLRQSPDNAQIILERIHTLADDMPEFGVMHTHDISISIYLYVLNSAEYPALALSAIDKIQSTKGFWWAQKMAEYIQFTLLTDQENREAS